MFCQKLNHQRKNETNIKILKLCTNELRINKELSSVKILNNVCIYDVSSIFLDKLI